MTFDVLITDKAAKQLRDNADWWARHRSAEQADRWYDGFINVIDALSRNPERCPIAPENDAFPMEIRELLFGLGRRPTHRAIFATRPGRVVVYAIRHVAQQEIEPDDL